MTRFIKALTLGLALLAGSNTAFAQYTPAPTPAPAPGPNNNRPVVFQGREDLRGMGDLTFIIHNGVVRMIDASKQPIDGRGTMQGNRVTFVFVNCVYDGVLNNDILSGTARFTSGPNAGLTWNFSVRHQPNQ